MGRPQILGNRFSPLYFLAALGNGGVAISFFIYLMFLVPHSGTPIPTFASLQPFFSFSNPLASAGVLMAMGGMLVFAFRHFQTLLWNLRQYRQFKQTDAYTLLRQNNAEVILMAIPLTLAMSVNVVFVLGAIFVPNLWNVVEYLFPLSLLAFASIGFFALRIYSAFFSRILSSGFDCERNNNLSQMTAVFAFAMLGVGFAASAAMSHTLTTVVVAMFG